MSRPRVLLADDHRLVLAGLHSLLEPECDVVASVEDGQAALEAAARLAPDLAILDVTMPGLDGIDTARMLKRLSPATRIMFLTMHAEPRCISRALQTGASGYVLKNCAGAELLTAIRTALRGKRYVSERALADMSRMQRVEDRGLTPRQREILALIARGRTSREIAEQLQIAEKTVEYHRASAASRIGAHSIAALTRYALENGLA